MNKDFWRGKKVLVTGHTGFKGSWLSLWLHTLGAQVFGYSLKPSTSSALYTLLNLSDRITSHYGDVRSLEDIVNHVKTVKPDIIIHMAAQPLVLYSYQNPVETYATNVMGSVHILEAARVCESVKVVINVTTDKCYENKEWVWAYRENESLGGYDPYSNSKSCSELVTAAYRNSFFSPADFSKHGKAIASARAGNVIGGGDWAADRLIPDIINAFLNGKKVSIRNPASIRPWQHVLEPLSGYLLLSEALWHEPEQNAEAWNFGPSMDDTKDVQSIVEYIAGHWGSPVEWVIDTQKKQHEATYLKLDTAKAKSRLGWQPCWQLEKTLNSIIDWYQHWATGGNIEALTLAQIEAYQAERSVIYSSKTLTT